MEGNTGRSVNYIVPGTASLKLDNNIYFLEQNQGNSFRMKMVTLVYNHAIVFIQC